MPGGHRVYVALQRQFGRFRAPNYIRRKLKRQAELARLAVEHGVQLDSAHVMELGTGWVPAMAFGFYLCGAKKVSTYDLNRYVHHKSLKAVMLCVMTDAGNQDIWSGLITDGLLRERMAGVNSINLDMCYLDIIPDNKLDDFQFFDIDYIAPGDARNTGFAADSIDIHCSTNTFEHIPREDLLAILVEARRVLKPGGVAIHYVDPTDHFAHADKTQSPVRFLNLTPRDIERYYRNRYTYQNLLFDRDYRDLFKEAGLEIVDVKFKLDDRSLDALKTNPPTLSGFENRDIEELSRRNLIYVARKRQ